MESVQLPYEVVDHFAKRKYSWFEVLYSYAEYSYVMTIGKWFDTELYRNYMLAFKILENYQNNKK